MSDLFDKRDILTGITADQAVKGDKGYFGGCLRTIAYNVEQDNVHRLCAINEDETSCFIDEEGLDYLFFLPIDKVKRKKITYRHLRSIDELFDFILPDCAGADYTTDEKVEKLLGQHYTIKNKIDGTLKQHIVSFLNTPADGTLLLDFVDLKFLFENYEFKKGDKFVPFGIEE
jgi:hypothetical protein